MDNMKNAIIKIIFKSGEINYFVSDEEITANKERAFRSNLEYMRGLCRGLNFSIKVYQDEFIERAELEIIND